MNNRIIYLTAIFGNFLLLVYAAVLIVGICGGWLDRELWLHSDVAKVAQLLLMASAMGLLFTNIRISRVRYGGRYLSLILLCQSLPEFIFPERQGRRQSDIEEIFKTQGLYIPSQCATVLAAIYIRGDVLYATD